MDGKIVCIGGPYHGKVVPYVRQLVAHVVAEKVLANMPSTPAERLPVEETFYRAQKFTRYGDGKTEARLFLVHESLLTTPEESDAVYRAKGIDVRTATDEELDQFIPCPVKAEAGGMALGMWHFGYVPSGEAA